MCDRDEKLHQWYTLHAGVVPMSQLVEFGYTERSVYRMVKRNELIILQPGVFQSTQYPTGDLQRQIAACMRNEHVMIARLTACLLYTSPSPRDRQKSRMPSSA